MKNIGEIISRYRQDRRMTQEAFASRLGVTAQAVSKWERGNGLPDVALIEGICRILDISPNILFDFGESKVVENNNVIAGQNIKNNMIAEPVVVEFGENLVPCFMSGMVGNYVNQKRDELVSRTGKLLPIMRIRDNLELEKNGYRILSYDKLLYEGKAENVEEAGYREMIDRTVMICEQNYGMMINKQLVKTMIDNVKELYPGVADGLIPEKISYLQVQRHLQEVLKQGESIRDMIHIIEELEEKMFGSTV
ncbi:MAG: FHIPEP family type III secretion protein [Lachnospiraceae bacterium]|nr:FHIPEP family type III secretion protein [Lachnospiraceae bacterium]